jgi:hypothetical protein
MKLAFLLITFFSANVFALGPIPNGTYLGNETCSVGSFSTRLTFTDTTMKWDDQINSFEFDANTNGFFNVRSVSGMSGHGLGHFITNGFHYEIIFDYIAPNNSIHPAPGEDTLTYRQGVIHLESSASAGPQGKVTCIGDFSIVH